MKRKILLPPGTGDIYWILTKLEDFCDKNQIELESYIWEHNESVFIDGKPRSHQYCERFPFLNYKGWIKLDLNFSKSIYDLWFSFYTKPLIPKNKKFYWIKSLMNMKNDNLGEVKEFDYIFQLNGVLENEMSLEDQSMGLDKYKTNWSPEEIIPVEQKQSANFFKNKFGRYICLYFSGSKYFVDRYFQNTSFRLLNNVLKEIKEKCELDNIVIFGAHWDEHFYGKMLELDPDLYKSVVNETNFNQLMGLMESSIGVFGQHCGTTMEAVRMGIPTIMWFTDNFDRWPSKFIQYHLQPDSYRSWYHPYYIQELEYRKNEIIDLAEMIFNKREFPKPKSVKETDPVIDLKYEPLEIVNKFIYPDMKYVDKFEYDGQVINLLRSKSVNYYTFDKILGERSLARYYKYNYPFTGGRPFWYNKENNFDPKRWEVFLEFLDRMTIEKSISYEIGCGFGGLIHYMKQLGWESYGNDHNKELEEFDPNRIKTIVMHHVIEHLRKPMDFISNLKNQFKNHQEIIGALPNSDYILCKKDIKSNWYGYPHHLHYFNKESLEYLFRNAGYNNIHIEASTTGMFGKEEWLGLDELKAQTNDWDSYVKELQDNFETKELLFHISK